jgi:hypothetical protein
VQGVGQSGSARHGVSFLSLLAARLGCGYRRGSR